MKKTYLGIIAIIILMLTGCKAPSTLYYLKDMEEGKLYPGGLTHESAVMANDRLGITVTCKKPELAVPFNNNGAIVVSNSGEVSGATGGSQRNGYHVDTDGNIAFPVLGMLHVEGMRVSEVKEMITKKIMQAGYIKDPAVSVEILNFHYTIIGDKNSQVYTTESDKVTLLDAIANAGGLSQNARIDRVHVIREVDGGRMLFTHDLGSKEIFYAPCYYLQQNDIVYLEPRKSHRRVQETMQYLGYAMAAVSAISAISLLIANLKK